MKYFVFIRGRTREVEIRDDGIMVDGEMFDASIRMIGGGPGYQLRVGDRHRSMIPLSDAASGSWKIHLEGQTFEVAVVDERTHAIRSMGGGPAPEGAKRIIAPMPGLVVRINVAVGDEVATGQGLVVVEAMKMENELKATAAGTVTGIEVSPGDAVEKGALLVSIE